MINIEKTGRRLLIILIELIIFIIGILISSFILNRGNNISDRTINFNQSELPTIWSYDDGVIYNKMPAHKNDVDIRYIHRRIHPFKPLNKMNFIIKNITIPIVSVDYSIYNFSNLSVYDRGECTIKKSDTSILFDIDPPSLNGKEAMLKIEINTKDNQSYSYYSRIKDATNIDNLEYINFVNDFIDSCIKKKDDISVYLEPIDNKNIGLVYTNLNSGFDKICFGKLNPVLSSSIDISFQEFSDDVAIINTNYIIASDEKSYTVNELYRLRKIEDRFVLLNMDRYMEEIFEGSAANFGKTKINLGITNSLSYMSSDNGDLICFTKGNSLFSYNNSLSLIHKIYDFSNNNNLGIKILNMDDNEDIDFLCYGYFDLGTHQGKLGIGVYHFTSQLNSVKEQLFIELDKDYPFIKEDIDELAYINHNNKLFLMINDSIYAFNLFNKNCEKIISDIKKEDILISKSQHFIVYKKNNDLIRLNLDTMSSNMLTNDPKVEALGFIQDDLIYGVHKDKNNYKKIIIIGNDMNTKKEYSKKGYLINNVAIDDRIIRLKLKHNNKSINDEIVFSGENKEFYAYIDKIVTEKNEVETAIGLHTRINNKNIKILTPEYISNDNDSVVNINSNNAKDNNYYLYYNNSIIKTGKNLSKLVKSSYEKPLSSVIYPNYSTIYFRSSYQGNQLIESEIIEDIINKKGIKINGIGINEALYFVQSSMIIKVNGKDNFIILGYDPYNIIVRNTKEFSASENYYISIDDAKKYLMIKEII